ncbi:MAG: diguanylate cyclase [Deltaproteobacteria bacterium]|nr:diguanylate cyclase [Deltaproteobacteria bacterium]
MNTILVVEDDKLFRDMFSDLLKSEGYQVDCASCGSEALKMLTSNQYDLVVTDLVMPDINGLEILSHVRESYPTVDVIMVTGNANLESAIYALKHGARDFLTKPVNPDEFKHSVAQCMQQRRLLDENEELKKMLTLFQASQAIAGCLDIGRVYQLLLDSIARETGISRAMGLFLAGGKLELNETKNISPESGNILAAEILLALPEATPEQHLIQHIQLISPDTPDGFREAYLIHILNQAVYRGVIVLFNDPDRELPDITPCGKNIIFLIEQSAHAFENAETFSHAKEMLFIDDISGLFNHRYLDIALDREMKRVERYASHLAVLFIDVDGFKLVNDTYGHLIGSRVLAEFGALLKKSVRDVDVVIRYGGDEYTAILVETPAELAQVVAERIRQQVEAHHFLVEEGHDIRLTCSIGYACCPDDAARKEDLIEMADKAMYAGKAAGKNRIQRISIAS